MQSYNHFDDSMSYQCSYQNRSFRECNDNNQYNDKQSLFQKQSSTQTPRESFEPLTKITPTSIHSHQVSSQYQALIYENKIQILNDRLQCYIEQVQNLKKTNSILLNKLSTIEQIDEQLQSERNKNFQLREQIQTYRDQIEDEKLIYQQQLEAIKLQLDEKDKFVDLMRQEHQKIVSKKDQQIHYLNSCLKQKINKLDFYEKKLHTLEMERLNTEEESSNYGKDSFIMMKNSQISRIKTMNSQNINSMNLQKSTVSVEQKAKMFMKRDPSELKIMVKSLTQAQKCLQIGGQELSMIGYEKQQQKSMLNASRLTKSKFNKTYCK